MRPLRCSMRLGFQGTSKWNRFQQWAWRFRPSRAASVAIRMRSGMLARVGVEGLLDLLALGSGIGRRRALWKDGDPLVGPVGPVDRGRELLMQVALRVVVLGEDEDPRVVPPGRRSMTGRRRCGRSGHILSRIQSISLRTRASGSAAGRLGDLGHLVEELLLAGEERFRGGIGERADGRRADRLDLGLFLGLQFVLGQRGPVVVAADALGQAGRAGRSWPSALVATASAWACSHCRWTVRRWTRRVRANASIEEKQPLLQAGDQQAGGGLLASGLAAEAALRGAADTGPAGADSRSSGASAGRPSMSIWTTCALGEPAERSRGCLP